MKKRYMFILPFLLAWFLSACGSDTIHHGRTPFCLMEKAPSKRKAQKKLQGDLTQMQIIYQHQANSDIKTYTKACQIIQPGDVITFYMPHKEAMMWLKKRNIQKIPYELFRYGHLALVTLDPAGSSTLKLLQVAMKTPVNTNAGLEYLRDKNWLIYRPPSRTVDPEKLRKFCQIANARANDPQKAYDYSGALGLNNAHHHPNSISEIGTEYTCATLIVAALNYSGYELASTHRGGKLDIITPRQVVESWGAPCQTSENKSKTM